MLALKSPRGQDWSPQSPDLNPCDFFLWGHLKERVYKPMPQNMQDLKCRIKEECRKIPQDMIRRSVMHMKERAALCVKFKGGAFDGRKI